MSMKGVGGQVESVCCELHVALGANLHSLMQDTNTRTETPGGGFQ